MKVDLVTLNSACSNAFGVQRTALQLPGVEWELVCLYHASVHGFFSARSHYASLVKFLGSAKSPKSPIKSAVQVLPDISLARLKQAFHLRPESLLANNAARRKAVRNYHYIKQKNCKDAARRRKSEQPADRADRPLGGSRTSISNAAAENDAEEEARDARRGER